MNNQIHSTDTNKKCFMVGSAAGWGRIDDSGVVKVWTATAREKKNF